MATENKTNLIINYLPQSLTDEDFTALFTTIGLIKSAKIIRDKATGYSYGFGFVDYKNPEDAERAIQSLNGYQMQNKTLKVAYARPSGEEIKNANLYITGLPKSWTVEDLRINFQQFGNIIQTRILSDQSGVSKGVGFVLYDKKFEADAAISAMNGFVAPGATEPINVKFAEEHGKNRALNQAMGRGGGRGGRGRGGRGAVGASYSAGGWNDYGGGYGNGTGGWGTAGYGYGAYDYSGGYSGGFGAGYGNQSGGPMRSQGNRSRFNPMNTGANNTGGGSSSEISGYVLFVYNIGTDAVESTLWQLFSPFGKVVKVNVIKDHALNQCKGYGFVTMSSYEEAAAAIQNLNGYNFTGMKPLQVSFKSSK